MAYADFTFYGSGYFGDTLTEETAPKWLERASDELDAITFGRLTFAFPTVEAHAAKVKKAVCAIAEALYWIDVQRRASSAQKAEDGSYHGAVASISSGRESISYLTGGANSSVYAAAATSAEAQTNLIGSIAAQYGRLSASPSRHFFSKGPLRAASTPADAENSWTAAR